MTRVANHAGESVKRKPHEEDGNLDEAIQENLQAIKYWEDAALHNRSAAERVSDRVTAMAGGGYFQLAHVVWFAAWLGVNAGIVPGARPFDPFPFPLLTTVVSLEAIFLALFVLASQNRLSRQSDKRAHLDLQIDLLAEREMTAVLQMLLDLAAHLRVDGTFTPAQIRALAKKTDVHKLADDLDAVPESGDARP